MENKSYQNNVEFYRMMQKIKDESKKKRSLIDAKDEGEKLLKLKEEIYKTQIKSQKDLLAAKEKEEQKEKDKNEEQRRYLEQLRKFDRMN